MCDCIDRINRGLESQGVKDRLLTSTSVEFSSGRTRQVLPVYTTVYTKGGNPKNGLPLIPPYCPFCGTAVPVEWSEDSERA